MPFYSAPLSSDKLLLVVETGNTTTSIVLFKGDVCVEFRKVSSVGSSEMDEIAGVLQQLVLTYPDLRDAAVCSVVPSLEESAVSSLGRYLRGRVVTINSTMRLPFRLHYDIPESFGADRIALCAFSQQLYPEEAVIALDIGTAITVDVLNSRGGYIGGLIMPGLDLMAKALHEHTARLPLVALNKPEAFLGCSTADCIRSGIIHGSVSGLEGLVRKISSRLCDEHNESRIRVIATGGNASLVASMLDSFSVVDELAVVKGTRYLFELNVHCLS